MRKIKKFLEQQSFASIYMIRAIKSRIKGFRFETVYNDRGDIRGMAAVWEDDKIVTLRGEIDACMGWFYQYYGIYDFFELDMDLMNALLNENMCICNENSISFYYIMEHVREKGAQEIERIRYGKADKEMWRSLKELYRKQYNIHFSEFQPDNMEWFVVYEKGFPISNLCLERGDDDVFILSNFYTAPDWRSKGIGTRFLQTILKDYGDHKFCLFVSCDNVGVVRLYKRLGFQIRDKVGNIERNQKR
ncbi:MAG: GNAT family N-acetyltransferase [Bacillota bacterium]